MNIWLTKLITMAPLFAVLAAAGCTPIAAQPLPDAKPSAGGSLDRVTAGTPQKKSLKLFTTQPARIEAFEETPLVPKIAGFVAEVRVDIGDRVQPAQPLLELSVPELQDELKQKESLVALAEAEVKQAQASVEAATAAAASQQAKVQVAEAGVGRAEGEYARWESEHARIKELSSGGSVTRKLLDETLNQFRAAEATRQEAAASVQSAQASYREAQVNVGKAEADVAAAEARLAVAQANLAHTKTMVGYTTIKAPFAGVVTRRSVDTGHYVHPASGSGAKPLLVIASTGKVRVSVDIPEMEASLVDVGDAVTVRIQSLAGEQFTGKVARSSWSLEASNRSMRAEVDLDNAHGTLRPGMYASLTVLLDQREEVLTLPASAIIREDGKTFCCTVEGDRIRKTPIETGLRSGDDIEIVGGIEADDLVVLVRPESLQPGQQVEVAQKPEA